MISSHVRALGVCACIGSIGPNLRLLRDSRGVNGGWKKDADLGVVNSELPV